MQTPHIPVQSILDGAPSLAVPPEDMGRKVRAIEFDGKYPSSQRTRKLLLVLAGNLCFETDLNVTKDGPEHIIKTSLEHHISCE